MQLLVGYKSCSVNLVRLPCVKHSEDRYRVFFEKAFVKAFVLSTEIVLLEKSCLKAFI